MKTQNKQSESEKDSELILDENANALATYKTTNELVSNDIKLFILPDIWQVNNKNSEYTDVTDTELQQYNDAVDLLELYQKKLIKELSINNLGIKKDFIFDEKTLKLLQYLFIYYISKIVIRQIPIKNNEILYNILKYNIKFTSALSSNYMHLDKGILLITETGAGKTSIFKSIINMLNSLNITADDINSVIIPAYQITKEFAISGFDSKLYNLATDNKIFIGNAYDNHYLNVTIDDIGTEIDSFNYYGTNIDIMENILFARYDIFKSSGKVTNILTNLSIDILKQRYDKRLISRFIEMFNIVVIDDAEDYRIIQYNKLHN